MRAVLPGDSGRLPVVRPTTYWGGGWGWFFRVATEHLGVSWDYNMSKILLVGLAKYYFGLSAQHVYNEKN